MAGSPPPGRSDRGLRPRGARHLAGILILSLWLVGWAIGEWLVVRELFFSDEPDATWFLALWLLAWTAGGLFAARALLRLLAGHEPPPAPPESPPDHDGGVG